MCLSPDLAGQGLRAAPIPNLVALFLGVWVIYLFDRTFDVSSVSSREHLTKRHQWTRNHFTLMASLGMISLGLLVLAVLPRLETQTLLAGIVPGLITVLYYLVFRFSRVIPGSWRLPFKEMTVAICFALGIWIAVQTEPIGFIRLILTGGLVLLFCGNCLLIARAENELDRQNDPAAYFAGESVGERPRWPEIMLILAMVLSLPVMIAGGFPLSSSCLLVCAALTLFLARSERSGGPDCTQAKADGILMIPLLVGLLKAAIFR